MIERPSAKDILANGYGATHMVMEWIRHKWNQTPAEMGYYLAAAIPEKLVDLLQLRKPE